MKIKDWLRTRKNWQIGAIIGCFIGLVLSIITMYIDWGVIGIAKSIIYYPFLLAEWIFEQKLNICSNIGCVFYFYLGGIIIYGLIGTLIGFIFQRVRRKNEN